MMDRMIRPGKCVINEKQPTAPTELGLDESIALRSSKALAAVFARGSLSINPQELRRETPRANQPGPTDDYLELLDFTGRMIDPGKRGGTSEDLPFSLPSQSTNRP